MQAKRLLNIFMHNSTEYEAYAKMTHGRANNTNVSGVHFQTASSLKPLVSIELFYPENGGTTICWIGPGHMTMVACTLIIVKK